MQGRDAGHGIYEIDNPEAFHNAIVAAKENNPYGAFVTAYDAADYKGKRLFVLPDGVAGIAVTEDGDIISVFKNPAATGEKNVLARTMMVALENGGKKLDCFDGFLPVTYSRFGFEPRARIAFNREYAPEGWNYERDGEPDVVFMAHDGASLDEIKERLANMSFPAPPDMSRVPLFDDYDQAVAARDKKGGDKQ